MMRAAIIILATFFLYSCGTGLSIRKSKVDYFNNQFTGTFDNIAFKVNGRRYGSPTLLDLFEIYNIRTESIYLRFNDSDELELSYKDNEGVLKKELFKGTFAKKGYYEVFLRNDKKEIPPFFPIIYGKYNVNRLRIALTIQGDLIIDNKWNKSGNILFLGAGDKGRRQSFFKKI
jgi:hypothetical protein